MFSFTSLLVAACAAAGALAAPAPAPDNTTSLLQARGGTPNSEGWHNGFYYSWWSDGGAQATYTNLNAGTYEVQWGTGGNIVGGKGWNPGLNARAITYTGQYQPNGNSYLAVYGWTRNPLVEYYIVENFGTFDPSSGASNLGTVTCDGSTYRLGKSTRYNQPSIDGTRTFDQYWSVRVNKRSSGTVQTGCHFDAWRNVGLNVNGNHYYQILATEGYQSSGYSKVTVSDSG
ncbi:hypothetical protein FQN54_000869 [Arachnomyces sp. PD_36]|nr:hypothetical protein FQN54_000869 [Arachnomyces sp. PD_36]